MSSVEFAAATTDTTVRVGGGDNTTALAWTGRTANCNYFSESWKYSPRLCHFRLMDGECSAASVRPGFRGETVPDQSLHSTALRSDGPRPCSAVLACPAVQETRLGKPTVAPRAASSASPCSAAAPRSGSGDHVRVACAASRHNNPILIIQAFPRRMRRALHRSIPIELFRSPSPRRRN